MADLEQNSLILDLALSLKENGSWAGETHVQKAAFFLKTLLKVPLDAEFILYKHGPFSFDLRETLTGMEANGFIKWNAFPPYGPSIAPGDLGQILKENFSELSDHYRNQIDFVAQQLGSKNVAELERVATALFVTKEGYEGAARVNRLIELKPHISVPLAESAFEEFDAISKAARDRDLIVC